MRSTTTPKKTAELIKELDTVFSNFVRLRDAGPDGKISCFVCGAKVFWKHSHAGHYMWRACQPTRYHEKNVHAICEECNCFDSAHHVHYNNGMILQYGADEVQGIRKLAHSLSKMLPWEYQEMIDYYKAEVSKLRKQKSL